MEPPEKMADCCAAPERGHRINRITVRDFSGHFGAERRGSAKVHAIRTILDSLDLRTDPDFETAWIDGLIWLRLKDGTPEVPVASLLRDGTAGAELNGDLEEIILESTPSAVQQAEEQTESAPISAEPETPQQNDNIENVSADDPTFRIGSLPAANKKLIVVNQNDSLTQAITLMLQHDFSQLPVMQGEREVKGVVTWKSIGSKQALGCNVKGSGIAVKMRA